LTTLARLAADAKAFNDQLEARVRAPRRDLTDGPQRGLPSPEDRRADPPPGPSVRTLRGIAPVPLAVEGFDFDFRDFAAFRARPFDQERDS
jgi:hypothetical protein